MIWREETDMRPSEIKRQARISNDEAVEKSIKAYNKVQAEQSSTLKEINDSLKRQEIFNSTKIDRRLKMQNAARLKQK